MVKLVYGVGFNDVSPVKIKGKHIKSYLVWRSMISRCYNKNYHKSINYVVCSVCDEWLTFSNFKSWMEQQDFEGKELDKDLLVEGNKTYSPETCCFIPQHINKFMTIRGNDRGIHPLGVTVKGRTFLACEGSKYIGSAHNPKDAHKLWQKAKLDKCNMYIATEKFCGKVLEGLTRISAKLKNHLENNIETKDL